VDNIDFLLGLIAAIVFGVAAFMRVDWPGRLVAGGLCLSAIALFLV
jgi:hypothetical protein